MELQKTDDGVFDLSFLGFGDDGALKSCWRPEISGDYAQDVATGRRYAWETVTVMRENDVPFILHNIAEAMPRGDERTGVEIGFWQGIAEALV